MNTKKDHGRSVEIEGDIIEPELLTPISLSVFKTENSHHKTAISPADLRSHTQRILHFIEKKDNKALYEALVDLFLVLGDKGLALRKRMLITAHTVLSDHEFDNLKQSLSLGLMPGSDNLSTQKVELENNNSFSAIDEAKYYVEYGELEEAANTLQEAILLNPRQLALHHDLLEIFQQLAKKELFISFYQELLSIKIALPPLWKKMALEFGYEQR